MQKRNPETQNRYTLNRKISPSHPRYVYYTVNVDKGGCWKSHHFCVALADESLRGRDWHRLAEALNDAAITEIVRSISEDLKTIPPRNEEPPQARPRISDFQTSRPPA